MGFSRRKRTNRQINGSTMIVPGSDPNLSLGGFKDFNNNITKARFTGQPPQPEYEQPKINPYGPLPSPSSPPQSPTPTPSITPTFTPTPSLTPTNTPTNTPTETPTPTPTPSQPSYDLYFGNATLTSVSGDSVYSGTSLITYLKSFTGYVNSDGQYPNGRMESVNGLVYGLTQYGGTPPAAQMGNVYSYDPLTNTKTNIVNFNNDGYWPYIGFTYGTDGNFYGTTQNGGVSTYGSLFKFDPIASAITYLHNFSGNVFPGEVIEINQIVYGVTSAGGSFNNGSLYSYNLSSNTFSTLVNFNSSVDGSTPFSIVYDNGYIYGFCTGGGGSNYGTFFRYDTLNSTLTKLLDFDGNNGSPAYGSLKVLNNKIYGSSSYYTVGNLGGLFNYDISTSAITISLYYSIGSEYGHTGDLIFIDQNVFGWFSQGLSYTSPLNRLNLTTSAVTQINNVIGVSGGLTYLNGKIYGVTGQGGSNNNGTLFSYEFSEPMSSITTTSFSQTFTFPSCSPAQYQYIVIPQSLGTPTSFVDQLSNPVAMESPYTTTVQSVVCNVYRTTNAITTGITIIVS